MLRQIILNLEPWRFRTDELMETSWAIDLAINGTKGNVEHVGFRLKIHKQLRAAMVTEHAVSTFRECVAL